MSFAFGKTPCISLSYKLVVPVPYREYEYGLLSLHLFVLRMQQFAHSNTSARTIICTVCTMYRNLVVHIKVT